MGAVKLLVLTDSLKVESCKGYYLRLKNGRALNLKGYDAIVSFGMKLRLPVSLIHVNVAKESVTLKAPFPKFLFGSPEVSPFYKIIDFTERVLRRHMYRNSIYSLDMLLNWLDGYRQFYLSLSAVLLAITLSKYKVLFNLTEKLRPEKRHIALWQVMFLPCTAYAVLKEVESILSFNCDRLSTPKECVNASLSYIVGNPFFEFLYLRSIGFMSEFGLLEPYKTKSHCSLPSRSRKLRKPRKGAQPLQNLFVF